MKHLNTETKIWIGALILAVAYIVVASVMTGGPIFTECNVNTHC